MIPSILINVGLQFLCFFVVFAIGEAIFTWLYKWGKDSAPKPVQCFLEIIHAFIHLPMRFIKMIILFLTFNKPKPFLDDGTGRFGLAVENKNLFLKEFNIHYFI